MDFQNAILPLTKNICRTCLMESDTNTMHIQDLVEYELNMVKLIDILVFLNCLENNDEENWPKGMCASCVSISLTAYKFKLQCLKANTTLSQILTIQNSPDNLPQSEIDAIDINVVNQDHEYDVPSLSNNHNFGFESNSETKEVTPLPPVSEITTTEQIPRKENDKKYDCTLCQRSFTRIYGLRYHMAKHSDIYKHLCPKCGKQFHTTSGLSQHMISHKENGQFKCGFCNKIYKSRQSLKDHFRLVHSSNRKLFTCITCNQGFTKKSTLMMHNKSHNGEKQYICNNCPKKFSRASYLRAHNFIHTGEERPKPFFCNYVSCERRFATKHSLLIHIAHSHVSERPFKCELCLKGFATAKALKVHRESHNKENITCNICNKILATRKAYEKHIYIHENVTNEKILETVGDDVFC